MVALGVSEADSIHSTAIFDYRLSDQKTDEGRLFLKGFGVKVQKSSIKMNTGF